MLRALHTASYLHLNRYRAGPIAPCTCVRAAKLVFATLDSALQAHGIVSLGQGATYRVGFALDKTPTGGGLLTAKGLSSPRPSQSIPGLILRLVRSGLHFTYNIYITVS